MEIYKSRITRNEFIGDLNSTYINTTKYSLLWDGFKEILYIDMHCDFLFENESSRIFFDTSIGFKGHTFNKVDLVKLINSENIRYFSQYAPTGLKPVPLTVDGIEGLKSELKFTS